MYNNQEFGKQSRRQSLNSDLMQMHKLSQNNKTFTDSFSVSLHQSKSTFNKKNISKLDLQHNNQIKNRDIPFRDLKHKAINSKPKTEVTRKRFSFNQKGKIKNFIDAIDDYIEQLNESSDSYTITSDSQSKLENMLFLKFNIIQKKQEQLKIKYKKLQQSNKIERYENQTLKNQLFGLHHQLEEEKRKNYLQQLDLEKQEQKNKELKLRYQYLSNSYLREKLKQENQKLKILKQHCTIILLQLALRYKLIQLNFG
ncbi:unnamed protein product (macronuclear) [Paramecium tetraurelia]|uniref:Uncharacterized protein n=1 Tax=Paramecium tetraurelia TaxID=5888 RepID=A0CK24_PARTE|nr:uncharacterized protein GSPATT00000853001 [Paramecium tetraurelia]CAK71141.1 unnamed protein product [Paramecium tetraurelia]|eukprot:XP_001438538.1 hypothetical protein (macronuclear) [Paramecium tetraurelia strain d4-2]